MRIRSLLTLVVASAALVVAARAVGAQPQGQYNWITPVAGWVQYSNDILFPDSAPTTGHALKDGPAFGARLGHQLNDYWGVEAAGLYGSTKEDGGTERSVGYTDFSGNLMYSPARWRWATPYLAVGGGWSYRTASGFDRLNYMMFEQAIGLQTWASERAGLRLEFRNAIDLPNKNYGRAHKAEQQYLAGFEWCMGGKPKDADGDGVPDSRDKCPNTPAGAKVDVNGCPMDTDGDGVYDGLDKCPDTPKGAVVDASGCPKDSDGDGVVDGIDQCPDTPKGAKVDAKGCTMDSDGDGVVDGIDQCPNTPRGAKVDAKGCPMDSDGDGVYDGLDQCPDTPKGAKVDASGCPIEVTEKETELLDTGMIRLQGVNFETGKSDLLPESFPILDQVGPVLVKWPQLKVEVGGHTDSRGSAAKNQTLSEARANAVRDYLLNKYPGISPDQMTAKGYGSTKPIAPNNSALNLAKNRRVEFVVLNKDVLKKEVERRKMLQK